MRNLFLLLVLIAFYGCYQEGDRVPAAVTGASQCFIDQLVPEATVNDVIPGDGLGNVTATDSTPRSVAWLWILPDCMGDRSERQTFSTSCPVGVLNWRLTVFDSRGCGYFTSGTSVLG